MLSSVQFIHISRKRIVACFLLEIFVVLLNWSFIASIKRVQGVTKYHSAIEKVRSPMMVDGVTSKDH